MDGPELEHKLAAGLVIKELEPGLAPDLKIHRYRYTTVSGQTKRTTEDSKTKREEAKADEVSSCRIHHILLTLSSPPHQPLSLHT